jgi:hypothetical protein
MLNSIDAYGGISDFRMSSRALRQRESSARILGSHWIKIERAVVSAALVYHEQVNTSGWWPSIQSSGRRFVLARSMSSEAHSAAEGNT